MSRLRAFCCALGMGLLLFGCPSAPGGPAGLLRPEPRLDPKAKCGQLDPLVVEWDPAIRGRLEALRSGGLIAVRYDGCDLRVLDCHAKGAYGYAAFTPKEQRVSMRDRDSLYANLPVGAASLEGKLQTSGELAADLTLVGRYSFERTTVRADELAGDCDQATHVIAAMTVGAFKLFAGGRAAVSGSAGVLGAAAGGSSDSSREILSRDGDPRSCASKPGDPEPPFGCGALVRLELTTIDLEDGERCNRTGTRLVACGLRFNPHWAADCRSMASFPSCARAAGDDCAALARCVQRGWAVACTPGGTRGCKETADCYYRCAIGGQSVDDCVCACTASLDPAKSLMLTKHNNCAEVFCRGLGGQAQNDCFMAHCQGDAKECWEH